MNLIVTCARRLEREAAGELGGILEGLGDAGHAISITRMPGILTAETGLDPSMVIRKTRERLADEPWHLRYCLRMIPVQAAAAARIEEIEEAVEAVRGGIAEGDTYRISIEKRDSDISGRDLISRIAKKFPNRVSLEDPDKIILVEVLGGEAGVAVIPKDGILSAEKAKRSLAE